MEIFKSEFRFYILYMIIAVFTASIIGIYYLNDMACFKAFVFESVSAVIAIIISFAAIKEKNRLTKPIAHWTALLFPLPGIFFTPVNMISTWGLKKFLEIRLIACLTIIFFAVTQIIVAAKLLRNFKIILNRG